MTNKSSLLKFLLRFDFSNKVIYILTVSILAAIYLFINVYFTEASLYNTLLKQSKGIEFHRKVMSAFQRVIKVQSQFNQLSLDEKLMLSTTLKINEPFFSSLVEDLKNSLPSNISNHGFYVDRIDSYMNNFHQIVENATKDALNPPKNTKAIRATILQLKRTLLDFADIINEIYDLQLAISYDDGLNLDILINRLPSFQNHLSNLLILLNSELTPQRLARINIHRDLLQENLEFINESQNSIPALSSEIKSLANFQINAFNFLDLIFKTEESSSSKESTVNTYKQGYKAIISSIDFYNSLWEEIKNSLTNQAISSHRRQVISGFLLLFGICVVLTPYLTRAFRTPLADLKSAAEKFAEGDLFVRIPIIRPDEVGAVSTSFNEMANIFAQIMTETDHFANRLSQCSAEIFSTTKSLENNLSVQELSIHNITQNSKNIVKTVQDFSKPLDEVNNTTSNSSQQALLSKESLNDMEKIMQNMVGSADNTVTALSSIHHEVDNFKMVINTLVIIADQINLLSLNTAIRANRTGVKKFGFSIIADKIRELAEQTACTTLEFEEIVQKTLANVSEIMNEIDFFGLEIKEALEDSVAVKKKFQDLLTMTQSQISLFNTINTGMQNQAEKTVFIDKTINELNSSIRKTNRSVRSLYVEIEYLYHATNNLHSMTKRYLKPREEQNQNSGLAE